MEMPWRPLAGTATPHHQSAYFANSTAYQHSTTYQFSTRKLFLEQCFTRLCPETLAFSRPGHLRASYGISMGESIICNFPQPHHTLSVPFPATMHGVRQHSNCGYLSPRFSWFHSLFGPRLRVGYGGRYVLVRASKPKGVEKASPNN